jgi:hypothetical protein
VPAIGPRRIDVFVRGQTCRHDIMRKQGLLRMKYTLLFTVAIAALPTVALHAQDSGPVEVSAAIQHDSLPSLRLAPPQADGYKRWHEHDEHRLPLPYVPPNQVDGALQDSARRSPSAPTFQSGIDGVGQGFTGPNGTFSVDSAPPDTVGAVGDTQYVQVVNTGLAVFDKATKTVVYGPVPTNTLWSGFGGQCENDNDGDAVVVYDKAANRWIISQFAVGTTPYLQCVAVSHTSDATGAWYRYAFSYGSVFPDYPKMGVWPDAYYETFNMFNGNSFSGSRLCAYDRASMLTGAAATQQCFQLSSSFGGVLPSDLDGSTPPPAGSPNYHVNFDTNSLNLWSFHVDWANTANTTLTGPTNLAVASFTVPCGVNSCDEVIQPGTQQQLDTLGDRLMHRLAYRNFGDHEALVVNHSVTVGTNHKNPYTGVRWYEIRSPGATPVVYQQSTFAPDTNFRWMGSIAMDANGNMALGYSVSSGTVDPAIRYTGRLSGDALNTMQAEATIIAGGGSQTAGLDRWGDYSAMTIDPVDDCTFWYTNEYLKTDGTFNWSTRIGSLKFAGCGAGKQDQSINFTSSVPSGAVYNGTAYVVTATATSGLPVALTIAAASAAVCSINGSGSGSQVSFIGVGNCTINANQSGNASYNAAPQVQQSFAVGQAAQTVNFTSMAPAAATYNGSVYTVTATATSGLAVTLTIDASASSVCQLDGSASGSHVSFIGVGTCKVDANQAGNANYTSATQAQQSFAVGKAAQTINFTSTAPASAKYNGSAYTVTATATSGLAVTLSIAAGSISVCALDGSVSGSHVSFIGVGSCAINANQAGNGNYNPAPQVQQSFSVGKATQTISFDSTAPLDASAGGATYQVLASATSGLAVALAIDASATSVCQLDGSVSGSHVSFIGVGSCKIDATQAGNANYLAAPGLQQSFTVVPGPPALLVFTTQPAAVTQGNTLATIAVTMEDALGDVIDDNASVVDFTIAACGGDIAIGSATMAHGVATLDSPQRFYTVTDPATLAVKAQTGALTGNSAGFIVKSNTDLVFADAFDGCRL